MQDPFSSRINEGVVYKCIDIQVGGVAGYMNKTQGLLFYEDVNECPGGWHWYYKDYPH